MSLSQSSEINLTNNGKLALNTQALANSARSAAESAYDLANGAQRTADGKNSVYRGTNPNTVPTSNLKVGDLYFTNNALYTWTGSAWEKTVSDTTGEEIHAKVEEAMAESKKSIDELDADIKAKVAEMDKEIENNKIQTGNALNFYKEQYYLSNSYTELTGGNWSDEVPTKTEGKYIWSRYVTANVGDPTNQQYSDPVCISGLDGKDGPQGPAGADVYYSTYEMSPNQQNILLTDLTPKVSATNLPKLGSHVIAPSGKVYEVTATYPNANPPRYDVGPQLTSIAGPVGPKGDAGDQGIPGPKGDNGQTPYVHFAYANSADGSTNFNVSYFSNALYVGTYTDYTPTDSGDYTKYTWSRLKGDTGPTGATGPKGDTGSTGFFIGTTPPPNPTTGTVWATNDSSGNMVSAKTWNGSNWVSTAFTQDLVAGNITADKIVGGTLDVNKITIKNAQNIPISSTVSLGDKISNIEQDANKIKFSMAGQGLDLVDGLDGELVMGYGMPSTTWDGNSHNACLTLPSTSTATEVLPQDGTAFSMNYNWEAGKTYTQSIIIETDAQINTNVQPQWTWYTGAGHNPQPAELVNLGNNCYRLIGSYTPNSTNVQQAVRIIDIFNFNNFVNITTGTYLKFRSPHFFCADDSSLSELKITANGLDYYVNKSKGSDVLKALLQVDPDNSVIAQIVNGNPVAAINLSKEGKVQIDGSHISLNASTTIPDATIKSSMIESLSADKLTAGTIDASQIRVLNLDANNITTGTLSARINDLRKFKPYVVSPSNTWNFDDTKSTYDNWFLIGEMNTNHVWNGPPGIAPYMYVTSRGTQDANGSDRYVVTVWKDNDPTQYQRVWNGSSWSEWVMLPNSQNIVSAINLSPDGVTIDGKNIHLNGQTHIDDGVINASKITVYNTIGDNKGNQYLAVAWGQLNSTIGSKDDQGNSLWGSINQTSSKLTSYYQELKNDGSSTRSLIQQKADQILLGVDQKVQYKTHTVSASSPWDFNHTKSIYENWFLNGDTGNYLYNGPDGVNSWMYVQSRGSADGTRFVTTVWRDYDPTQYQRTWTGDHWTPWVMLPNSSNLVSAINLSPDGVTIDGKNIELNGNTTIHGQLNLLPTDQRYVDQRVQGFHNPWAWRDAKVFAGSGGLQLQSTIVSQSYSDDNTSISGLRGDSSAAITTLAPTYLKFTLYPSWNDVVNNFSNQLCRTYIDAGRIETNDIDAGRIETNEVHVGNFRLMDSKMCGLNGSIYVTNWHGTNFDNAGAVGFQVWGGIGLGEGTIYTPNGNLYIQQGNVGPLLGQSYSDAGKVDVHCNSVISQRANTVSSRLSVKTAITPVSYDRALAAVEGTEMYDYRYVSDDSSQHYVSGIIDDVNPDPQYHMDDMLINKERTARIDANLIGYHHVVLQELLKKIDELQAELNELKSKEK